MKGLEFAIIRYGYICNDLAWNVALPYFMNRDNREKYGEFCEFPGSCILIKHPVEGYILYDVGDCDGLRPAYMEENFPLKMNREDAIDMQLRHNGISVNDISAIIISHLHYDHANGLKYFSNTKAGQNIYVPRADFLQACEACMTNDDEKNSTSAYWRSTLTVPGIKLHLLDEDLEIFEGVHLYQLEGHTACVMGMMLECEVNNYLFPSDACGSALNYGPPAKSPGIIYDSLGFARCIKKLNKLEKEYNAKIIFSHDREQDKITKKFPQFYR